MAHMAYLSYRRIPAIPSTLHTVTLGLSLLLGSPKTFSTRDTVSSPITPSMNSPSADAGFVEPLPSIEDFFLVEHKLHKWQQQITEGIDPILPSDKIHYPSESNSTQGPDLEEHCSYVKQQADHLVDKLTRFENDRTLNVEQMIGYWELKFDYLSKMLVQLPTILSSRKSYLSVDLDRSYLQADFATRPVAEIIDKSASESPISCPAKRANIETVHASQMCGNSQGDKQACVQMKALVQTLKKRKYFEWEESSSACEDDTLYKKSRHCRILM